MTRKIKLWCDSGANIHSCKRETLTLEEAGFTEEEWDNATDEEKEEFAKEWAYNGGLEIGYSEATDDAS